MYFAGLWDDSYDDGKKYVIITIGVRKKKDWETPRKIPRVMKIHNGVLIIFLK